MEGYIKLYRKSLDSATFKNPNLWQVWCYCLMRANHKTNKILFDDTEMILRPGQFITGRFEGSKDCNMKPSTFRNPIELRPNYFNIGFVMNLQSKNNSLLKISFTPNDVGDCTISALEIIHNNLPLSFQAGRGILFFTHRYRKETIPELLYYFRPHNKCDEQKSQKVCNMSFDLAFSDVHNRTSSIAPFQESYGLDSSPPLCERTNEKTFTAVKIYKKCLRMFFMILTFRDKSF